MPNPLLDYEIFAVLVAVPLYYLFRRAGLKPWPVVTVFIPLLGFPIAASALAFPRWPALPPPRAKRTYRK